MTHPAGTSILRFTPRNSGLADGGLDAERKWSLSVADEFDPYYTWLGIRPEEQPADHYRLIGLRQFEENADVISNAVDQNLR